MRLGNGQHRHLGDELSRDRPHRGGRNARGTLPACRGAWLPPTARAVRADAEKPAGPRRLPTIWIPAGGGRRDRDRLGVRAGKPGADRKRPDRRMGELDTPTALAGIIPSRLVGEGQDYTIPSPLVGEGRVGAFQGGGSPIVGVFPENGLAARRRLFSALEQAFDVCFEGRREGDYEGLAGAVCFGDSPSVADTRCPTLHFSLPRNNSRPLVGGGLGWGATHPGLVTLSDDELMDVRLRGRSFSDAMAGGLHELPVEDGDRALARCGRSAPWVRRRDADGIAPYLTA